MYRLDKHGRGSNKKNPFIMFASEKKAEWERNGQRFPDGIRDVVPLAGQIWKNMTDTDRQPYKDKANEWNGNHLGEKLQKVHKTKSIGPSPKERLISRLRGDSKGDKADEDEEEIQIGVTQNTHGRKQLTTWKEEEIPPHLQDCSVKIEQLLKNGDPKSRTFAIIDFSCFTTVDGDYLPAEIGLTAFSLQDGVVDNYSTMIDPGEAAWTRIICFSNGMPKWPEWSKKSCNFRQVIKNVKTFLQMYAPVEDHSNKSLVLCKKSEAEVVSRCLEWLRGAKGDDLKYQLLSLGELFYQLATLGNDVYEKSGKQRKGEAGYDQRNFESLTDESTETPPIQETSAKGAEVLREIDEQGRSRPAFANENEATVYLQSQDFAQPSRLSCSYLMNEVGIHRCPLNRVNRYAFIMRDFLVGYWGILAKDEQNHTHEDLDVEKEKRRNMLEVLGARGLDDPTSDNEPSLTTVYPTCSL